jgi:hypothetical protein
MIRRNDKIVTVKPVPVVPVGACSSVLRQETRRRKQQERKSIISFGMTVLFMVCTVILTSMILLNQVAFDAPTSIPQQHDAVVNQTEVQVQGDLERKFHLVRQKLKEYTMLLEQKRDELDGIVDRKLAEQKPGQESCQAPSGSAPVVSYDQGSFQAALAPPKPEVNYQCVHRRAQRNVFRRDALRSFM